MKLKKPSPTKASPGSIEKIAVLAQRFAAGEELWHAADQRRIKIARSDDKRHIYSNPLARQAALRAMFRNSAE